MYAAAVTILVAALGAATAAPVNSGSFGSLWGNSFPGPWGSNQLSGCDVSSFVPTFPSNQTAIVSPSGVPVTHLGLAFGTQNYTCSNASTYTYVASFYYPRSVF